MLIRSIGLLAKLEIRHLNPLNRMCCCAQAVCVVRDVDSDHELLIAFKYSSSLINERMFYFKRSKDEKVGHLFDRISKNINNIFEKKAKKSKQNNWKDLPKITLELYIDGNKVNEELKNIDVWKEGAQLKIGEREYIVNVNTPSVESMKLPKSIMNGFYVYPIIKVQFCAVNECQFIWYRQRLPNEKPRRKSGSQSSIDGDCDNKNSDEVFGYGGWIKASTGFYYNTTNDDIGRKLKVVCVPSDGIKCGFELEAISPNAVEAGPGFCPFEERLCFTKDNSPIGSFRIVCYNILADLYADSDFTRTVLFPYCPPYALEIDYRKQLLIKEITGYNADLYCLQEVDRKVYNSDLNPIMCLRNFKSLYSEKGGQVVEGLVCFYRSSKFELLDSTEVILADELQSNQIFTDLLNKINSNENLSKRILARTTVFQCVLLKSLENPDQAILLGNTHLYFHPNADNIRLIQSYMCVKYMEDKITQYQKKIPSLTISAILCGDFNSCPEFGVYQLMTTNFVPQDSPDWQSNSKESIEGMPLSHQLSLSSACGTPLYTNYTLGFNGCLDYIYYDTTRLDVSEVIPFASHQQITQHSAIPNIVFPSDHLALVCTLKWTHQKQS